MRRSACLLGALLCALAACLAVHASASPSSSLPVQLSMRGVWIASVTHIDWPSAKGMTPAQQRAELIGLYENALANKLNAVYVQVRPTADAFWPSPYEPWSHWLTGTQGQDPGWDPLGFAVEEAHKRGLEFHAWMNPYRVTMSGGPEQLVPEHPARRNPHWTVLYNNQVLYNPGLPEVRQFVVEAMLDAVVKYDIDGFHWDDYFYPYPVAGVEFPDEAAFKAHGGQFAVKNDWRRYNVDALVLDMRKRIKAVKPHVQFGISPFGVWRNIATDPLGSNTTAGCQTFDDLYADVRKWVREEWIDYVVPQIYWYIGFGAADYAQLLPWWAQQVKGTKVQLYIGEATYRVGAANQPSQWHEPDEMSRHLALSVATQEVRGHVYFSAKDVRADRLGSMSLVVKRFYNATQTQQAPVESIAYSRR